MATVYDSRPDGSAPGDRVFAPTERIIYRLLRVNPQREQRWNVYAIALVAFSLVSFLAVYGLQRFQHRLVFNPTDMPAPPGAHRRAGRDLEVIPRRTIEHRYTTFEEMDVDAVLRRRPAMAAG